MKNVKTSTMIFRGNQLLESRRTLVDLVFVTITRTLAISTKLFMKILEEYLAVFAMTVNTILWERTVNSANHSSITT